MTDPEFRDLDSFVESAHSFAESWGSAVCQPIHLLASALDDAEVWNALDEIADDIVKLHNDLEDELEQYQERDDSLTPVAYARVLNLETRAVLDFASEEAKKSPLNTNNGLHLLSGIINTSGHLEELLKRHRITRASFNKYINNLKSDNQEPIDSTSIIRDLDKSSRMAPDFDIIEQRLQYTQKSPREATFRTRKLVAGYLGDLRKTLEPRHNIYPYLCKAVDRYAVDLAALNRQNSAIRVYISGLSIESLIEHSLHNERTRDQPPLDIETRIAAQSFLIAYALLISNFPDLRQLSFELDQFDKSSAGLTNLRRKVLVPALRRLAMTDKLLERHTRALTQDVCLTADESGDRQVKSNRARTALSHSWLRGVLSSMGRFILKSATDAAQLGEAKLSKEVFLTE